MGKNILTICLAILLSVLVIYFLFTPRNPVPASTLGEPYNPRTGVAWYTRTLDMEDIGWIINCVMTTMRDNGYLDDINNALVDTVIERLEDEYAIVRK